MRASHAHSIADVRTASQGAAIVQLLQMGDADAYKGLVTTRGRIAIVRGVYNGRHGAGAFVFGHAHLSQDVANNLQRPGEPEGVCIATCGFRMSGIVTANTNGNDTHARTMASILANPRNITMELADAQCDNEHNHRTPFDESANACHMHTACQSWTGSSRTRVSA